MDNSAFPVRIKVWISEPWTSDQYQRIETWLLENVGHGRYAKHCSRTMGEDSAAYFFRTMDAGCRFLAAFPELELADGTISPSFIKPHLSWVPPEWQSGPREPAISHQSQAFQPDTKRSSKLR